MRPSIAVLGSFLVASFAFAGVAFAQDLAPPPPLTGQPQQTQPQPLQPPPPDATAQTTLAPPPPLEQQITPPPPTTQRLDDSKKEDSGRGLEFLYVNGQIGGVFDALGTFNNSLQLQQTNAGGLMVGAEAGIRFVWMTLGLRFRYDMLQPFNIWQLNAVLGFHIPAGKWDPYVAIHGGYSAIGSLDPKTFDASQIAPCTGTGCTSQDAANAFSAKGGNVGFAVGVDYYFARFISIGVGAEFELLFLHRDPLAAPAACTADPTCNAALQSNALYQKSGDAAGIGLIASAHLALHL